MMTYRMPSTLNSNNSEALKTVISIVKWSPSYSIPLEFFPLVYIDFGTFVKSERSLHTVLTAVKLVSEVFFVLPNMGIPTGVNAFRREGFLATD